MNKKLADFLFVFGIAMIIVGLLAGVVVGFVTGEGFNFVPAITIWLICVVLGTGFVSVAGSVNEVKEKHEDDDEMLKLIIEKVKNNDEMPILKTEKVKNDDGQA